MDTQDNFSEAGTLRVRDRLDRHDDAESFIGGIDSLNIEQDLLTADGDLGADELNLALLNNSWAARMFTGGDGAPATPSDQPLVKKPTLQLLKLAGKLAKEAVGDLFKMHREEVQRSWGRMLDQEEATGYLVCDALGCELVQEEARKIGKKVVFVLKRRRSSKPIG